MEARKARIITNEIIEKELKEIFVFIEAAARDGGNTIEASITPRQVKYLENQGYGVVLKRVEEGNSVYRIFW